jgi:hypothetical protein
MTTLYPKCHAEKWKDKTRELCCTDGRIVLHQTNSRQYNTLFLTSFLANEIVKGNFMPTFKIQGKVHNLIDSLLPENKNNAKFLQIYFSIIC